jgi:hypothetical protein
MMLRSALALILCAATAVHAQTAADTHGKLRAPKPIQVNDRVPAALRPTVSAKLQSLYDIVLRDPGVREPIGYDSGPYAIADMPARDGYRPIEYDVTNLMYWYRDDPPRGVRVLPVSMVATYVFGNGIDHFWRLTQKWQEDDQGAMYWDVPKTEEMQGFPYYEPGVVVITKNPRPIFLPVARERALRFLVAKNRADMAPMEEQVKALPGRAAENQAKIVARYRACIQKMEDELAALSPADRAAPAYLARTRLPGRDQLCDPLASATDPDASQIIRENPEFYDRTLPPSAIQVIFVNVNMLNRKAPDQRGQHDRFTSGLDMAALAGLTMSR